MRSRPAKHGCSSRTRLQVFVGAVQYRIRAFKDGRLQVARKAVDGWVFLGVGRHAGVEVELPEDLDVPPEHRIDLSAKVAAQLLNWGGRRERRA